MHFLSERNYFLLAKSEKSVPEIYGQYVLWQVVSEKEEKLSPLNGKVIEKLFFCDKRKSKINIHDFCLWSFGS